MRILAVVFSLVFQFLTFAQIDFNNFQGLQSKGPVPNDFTDITKDKINSEKKSNRSKEKSEKTDAEIIASTNYAIDRILQNGNVLFNDPVSNFVRCSFKG